MSETKLLPCPFCGSTNVGVVRHATLDPISFRYYVECRNNECMASGPYDLGESGAAEAWNTRPGEHLPTSIQEALNSGDGVYRP